MSRRRTTNNARTAGKTARRSEMRVFDSMQDADAADRAYWWSRTPSARLRELERLRQLNYGYGKGRPLPRFQSTLRVVELGRG
jgi:hypothetical protein